MGRDDRLDGRHWQEWEKTVWHLEDQMAVISSGERWQSRLRFPECYSWVLFTSQTVTPLLSFCCFTKPSNLSTQTWGFWVLAHGTEGPGEWIPVEMIKGQGAGIVPWKFQPISSTFTPWKNLISVLFGVAPSPGGLLLSTLAPKWAAFTLTCVLNIVSQYHSYTFHIKIPL